MIVLALSQFSISRLNETWKVICYKMVFPDIFLSKGLDSASERQWKTISTFASYENNYKSYRNYMRELFSSSTTQNVMPFLGLYLKDLTFIEDGNANFSDSGAVNFFKMRMVASVISDIQRAQKSSFNFTKKLDVLSFLSYGLLIHDEDQIWKLSTQCEASSEVENSPSLLEKKAKQALSSFKNNFLRPQQPKEPMNVVRNPLFKSKTMN